MSHANKLEIREPFRLIRQSIPANWPNSAKIAQHHFAICFAIHSSSSIGKPHRDRDPTIQRDRADGDGRGLPESFDPMAERTGGWFWIVQIWGPSQVWDGATGEVGFPILFFCQKSLGSGSFPVGLCV